MTRTRPNVPAGVRPIGPGDVLHLTREASPQFARPIVVRVIRLCDFPAPPPYGWEWVDVYQLDARGLATERRSLFVLIEGVRVLADPPSPAPARRSPVRRTPARIGA
ncbi:hypothetical protein ACFWDN_21085 [Micromonospora chalcea]